MYKEIHAFLLGLINQLMDFRKVDSEKMELIKTQQNFIEFLDDLILPSEDLQKIVALYSVNNTG